MNDQSRFDRRRERTRKQLQEAATALILEKGFAAVSIQDITDRADLGRGTFYLHFHDKDEIAARILQESFEAIEALAPDMSSLSIDQQDILFLTGYFTHIAGQKAFFEAIGEMTSTAAVAAYLGKYMHQRAEERLARGNFYPGVPIEIGAHFITGALMQMTSWWLGHTGDYSAQQVAAMFFQMQSNKPLPDLSA